MEKTFFAVGIGASTGGLESLTEFFKHIPANIGVAFVVVTHLQRDHKSILDQLLRVNAKLPVMRIDKDVKMEPSNIYILTENTQVTIKDSILKVKVRDHHIINSAVDIFMKSLASDFQRKAVGIILSGAGSDGLEGAKAIFAHGGIVMVEDPLTAKADGMPDSIINHDHPLEILSPGKLAENLVQRCKSAAIAL